MKKFIIFCFSFVILFVCTTTINAKTVENSAFTEAMKNVVERYENVELAPLENKNQYLQNVNFDKSKIILKVTSLEMIKNSNCENEIAEIEYYKNDVLHIDSISSYSIHKEDIQSEVVQFFDDRMSYIKQDDVNQSNDVQSNLFKEVTSGNKRIIKKPYGYMDHSYSVKKYRVNDISSLYIVETNSDYVPGFIAYLNGDTSFKSKYKNIYGYVHLNATQAIDEIDQSTSYYGAVPCFKDAWPTNSPGSVTITSTYASGLTYGYSYTNGFSLDNVTSESNQSIGANISYGYSKSYTTQEPRLSTQHDSKIFNKYQWSYYYETPENGNETIHLNTGYLFEMNNSGHEMVGEGQFGLEYNFKMNVFETVKKGDSNVMIQQSINGSLYVNWW